MSFLASIMPLSEQLNLRHYAIVEAFMKGTEIALFRVQAVGGRIAGPNRMEAGVARSRAASQL